MRLLLERVLITVVDASEQVRLECHWHGGNRTAHTLVRPVARVKALSTYAALIARATELHRAGNGCAGIAAILNQEAWRPPKRRDTFNAPMVRRLLTTAGVIEPSPRRPRTLPERQPDEWTIRELADRTRRAPADALQLGAERPLTQPLGQGRRRLCQVGDGRRRHHRQPEDDPSNAAALAPIAAACAAIPTTQPLMLEKSPWPGSTTVASNPQPLPARSCGRGLGDRYPALSNGVSFVLSKAGSIVSRHSDGIPYPMPGPKPQGDRALTSAERMRRLREKRKAEAADKPPDKPPVVIRYRRPKDRRSRPDQWADAINTLMDCLDRYQQWRDNLPDSLADSALAERLDAMLEWRDLVDQLSLADPPRGFGRD